MNTCYFTTEEKEVGLTSTSANYIANKSKEMIDAILAESARIAFLNKEYTVVGKEPIIANGGKSETWLKNTVEAIDRVGKLSALNAWLREAIKEKEEETKNLNAMTLEAWCALTSKETMAVPGTTLNQLVSITDEYIISKMSCGERQKYLTLEAKSAAIGKFIHKGQPFDEARKNLHKLKDNVEVSGTGDQLTMVKYVPSLNPTVVDEVYMQLQEKYREVQAELNGIKNRIKLEVTRLQQEAIQKNKIEWTEYNAQHRELSIEFEAWRKAEVQRVAALKIKIPENLRSIYDTVKNS